MSAVEFYQSTPPEINLMIEAYNDQVERDYLRDYQLGVLISTGFNSPKEFPKFAKYYMRETNAAQREKENAALREQGARVGMRVP